MATQTNVTRKRQQELNDQVRQEQEQRLLERQSALRQRLAEASHETGNYGITEDALAAEDQWGSSMHDPAPESMEVDDSDWEDDRVEMIIICGDARRRRGRAADTRLREDRIRHAQQSWIRDMEDLVTAYLQYKHDQVPDDTSPNATAFSQWTIIVLGVRELDWKRCIQQNSGENANAALLRCGLLGATPVSPSTAFSVELLELYHQLRRHQPSLSIQAMVKTMCAIHNVTYRHSYRQQFSDAFDAYLLILRHVRRRTDAALGRGDGWMVKNQCPACSFEVHGESALTPSRLHAMDGNESLKRVAGWGHADKRTFPSDLFISVADVDKFKDDVKHRTKGPRGEDREKADESKACTADGHWKMTNSSEASAGTFDECGGFISACRHHFVETFCSMINSGELAKYGLATVNTLLDVFGKNQGIGYDIGCTHRKTIRMSSIGDKAAAAGLDITVDSFHGYAHNRPCQLQNHPLYRQGYGIEDLSTCERIFSSSNAVARLVRHASKYHFGQFIDLHFRHWNQERYLELSNFLLQNYRQAQRIITEGEKELVLWRAVSNATDADIEAWREEELEYLQTVTAESEGDLRVVAYVEALEQLRDAQTAVDEMRRTFDIVQYPASSGKLPRELEADAKAREAARATRQSKLLACIGAVEDTERLAGITVRWLFADEQYQSTLRYIGNRAFERAVSKLEGLVVQRLSELAKANLAGAGYKMRKHIAQNLSKRCEAIRTALAKYNNLAPKQDPPRPILQYSDIVSYALLGEFELLKHSRHQILQRPWSAPQNRQMADKYHKVKRAKEELQRVSVEARRLHCWIDEEDACYQRTIATVQAIDTLLAAELSWLYERRRRVNNVHRACLKKLYDLPGIEASSVSVPVHPEVVGRKREDARVPPCTNDVVNDSHPEDVIDGIDEDDHLNDEATRLGDFMESITD